MVFHRFPQTGQASVVTNTNFPPQHGGTDSVGPSKKRMLYEDLEDMRYENNERMLYEG